MEQSPFVDAASAAMKAGKRLKIVYNNEERIVEVHALGMSPKFKPVVRAFQVEGGSFVSETSGWKMFSIDKIEAFEIIEENSLAPREGYNPDDAGMGEVFAEISNVPVPPQQTAPPD